MKTRKAAKLQIKKERRRKKRDQMQEGA